MFDWWQDAIHSSPLRELWPSTKSRIGFWLGTEICIHLSKCCMRYGISSTFIDLFADVRITESFGSQSEFVVQWRLFGNLGFFVLSIGFFQLCITFSLRPRKKMEQTDLKRKLRSRLFRVYRLLWCRDVCHLNLTEHWWRRKQVYHTLRSLQSHPNFIFCLDLQTCQEIFFLTLANGSRECPHGPYFCQESTFSFDFWTCEW